jgi:mono/diheme cytochrome c family protein
MRARLFECIAAALLACCVACSAGSEDELEDVTHAPESLHVDIRIARCRLDPRVRTNVVALDVCVGADLFLRETFNGNGRSCASCHRVERNFTIDPEFIASLPGDDALFVAEFNPTLAGLERPAEMRALSLILENADGFGDDPTARFVLRSVPHNLSMGTSVTRAANDTVTPPDDRTGWSGDGAPNDGRLRDFQTGAIVQHYPKSLARVAGTDFRLASDDELDRIDLFMRRLGRTNELNLPGAKMADAGAESGRLTFLSDAARCNGCHGNAGANTGGANRNFNTGVESARTEALAAFPVDGGFLGAPANPDGSFGNGTFNTPPLIEAADTGPFFHTATSISGASAHDTSVAETIEQAVAFYDSPAFNASPAGAFGAIDLTASQIDDVGRFLRVVNAAFNAQLALKRIDAGLELVNHFQNRHRLIQRRTLALAVVEIEDALEVLSAVRNLNASSQSRLRRAVDNLEVAIATSSHVTRQSRIASARNETFAAFTALGTGLDLIIGDGTVMF